MFVCQVVFQLVKDGVVQGVEMLLAVGQVKVVVRAQGFVVKEIKFVEVDCSHAKTETGEVWAVEVLLYGVVVVNYVVVEVLIYVVVVVVVVVFFVVVVFVVVYVTVIVVVLLHVGVGQDRAGIGRKVVGLVREVVVNGCGRGRSV